VRKEEVLPVLERLDDLLGRHRVAYVLGVHDLVRRVAACPAGRLPAEIVGQLRGMYEGNMGSLTDLYISRSNGHEVEDEDDANRHLNEISDELWRLVDAD